MSGHVPRLVQFKTSSCDSSSPAQPQHEISSYQTDDVLAVAAPACTTQISTKCFTQWRSVQSQYETNHLPSSSDPKYLNEVTWEV